MTDADDRYLFKPFPGSSHHWALDEVSRLSSGPLQVLDIGAARGHVSAAIRAQRHNSAEFTAVEPVEPRPLDWPESDSWLNSLDEVNATDFDLVLALDVLEHVANPDAFLRQIVTRCRPGATLLISVPNVAHWSVRAQLAVGKFDYSERGILDRTHLRFFTQRSFLELVRGAGLTVVSQGASVVPLELLLPDFLTASPPWRMTRLGRRLAARMLPGLLGFQLLVRARA